MEERILDKLGLVFTKQDLRKLLFATIFFFFLFSIIDTIDHKPDSLIKVDYLSGEYLDWGEERLQEHGSPATDKLYSLCQNAPFACQKVLYSWDLSEGEKLQYISQYISVYTFIDQTITQGGAIEQVLKKFILNAHKGKRRGGATASRITINLASMGEKSEYRGVLTHEFGHVVDLGSLQGKSKHKDQNYTEFGKIKFSIDDPSLEYYRYSRESEEVRKELAKQKDFCSGYGMTNPFEDFAECHNLYLNNATLFRKMAKESQVMKNKYNYLANLFANQKLQDNKHPLLYSLWRPWDTTVI